MGTDGLTLFALAYLLVGMIAGLLLYDDETFTWFEALLLLWFWPVVTVGRVVWLLTK